MTNKVEAVKDSKQDKVLALGEANEAVKQALEAVKQEKPFSLLPLWPILVGGVIVFATHTVARRREAEQAVARQRVAEAHALTQAVALRTATKVAAVPDFMVEGKCVSWPEYWGLRGI